MSKNPEKDFGPIADDYAFFEHHATEAEEDARAYAEHLGRIVPAQGPLRLLDFGCGSGPFTARLLQKTAWPPERLHLTLVEPVASARRQAVARLAGFTKTPVADSEALPAGLAASFDVILANHVFYYVPDLRGQLARLIETLSPQGTFVAAIAARTNALIEFWITGFRLLGRDIPYHTSEDVETALKELGAAYQKQEVAYELTFPDTEENRLRILRFLLADHLAQLPRRPLMDLFDQHRRSGRIEIRTASDHYTIRSANVRSSGAAATARDNVSGVYLLRADGAALLQHRDDKPGLRHANMWVPPGGLCDPGESALACALREFEEETNYRCGRLHYVTTHEEDPGDNWKPFRLHIFVARYDGLQTIECREGQALRFVPRAEADALLCPSFVLPLWDQAQKALDREGA